jgi:hypothetical protein
VPNRVQIIINREKRGPETFNKMDIDNLDSQGPAIGG